VVAAPGANEAVGGDRALLGLLWIPGAGFATRLPPDQATRFGPAVIAFAPEVRRGGASVRVSAKPGAALNGPGVSFLLVNLDHTTGADRTDGQDWPAALAMAQSPFRPKR
jgi:hypothetical protein